MRPSPTREGAFSLFSADGRSLRRSHLLPSVTVMRYSIPSNLKESAMSDLVFYTNPMSRGRTVRWMLEEVGQPYETVLLEYENSMKSPEYLAVNPMGKVPALKHGDTVVTETAAICAYLADAFPQVGLAP